jgi:DNA polymerase III subunit gamma/tau
MAAIYQRARPARFDEVVGQDHVTSLLVAAIGREAVGHAYLFSGPRGVGKTTTARLLAMAVNCDAGIEQRPCGRCVACRAVQEGAHPDVVELDAASNNSVEDVRELREQVRLAPLRGGRRVWILDEAHMLSRAAANALLKTLEEPPPGLLFVLATTEPEKLPATILSRCQHFRFRRLSDDEIRGKLERLLAAAATPAELGALDLLARTADGAMRDAESLLERLLAAGAPLTVAAAETALGLPPKERLARLATALIAGDLRGLLAEATELYGDGFAPRTLAERLARTLRDLLVAHVRGVTVPPGLPQAPDEDALIRALHALDDAQERFVRRGDLFALEVTLIRACSAYQRPAPVTGAADVAPAGSGTEPGAAARTPPVGERPRDPAPAHAATPTEPLTETASATPAQGTEPRAVAGGAAPGQHAPRPGGRRLSWHTVLGQAGPQLKAFLLPAEATLEGDRLEVRYDARHAFHFAQLQRREQEFLALVDAAGGDHLYVDVEGPGGRFRREGGQPQPQAPAKKA